MSMKKFSATKLAFALAVCALAPYVRAQTHDVKDEAVRERRATTTTADAPKGEPESKDVQTNKTEPASPTTKATETTASAEVKDAAKDDDGADELRAQIAS
ncbi:MAG: hypothetical protein DMF65_04250, partial [Acidobacteria bacterium]